MSSGVETSLAILKVGSLHRVERGIVRDSSTSLDMTNGTRVAYAADAAASTETDAEFFDPFDYAQGGFARNERIK